MLAPTRRRTRSRRSAYGILAMAGLAAVLVLIVGLVTIGVLGSPTGGPASASDAASASGPEDAAASSPEGTSASGSQGTPSPSTPAGKSIQSTPSPSTPPPSRPSTPATSSAPATSSPPPTISSPATPPPVGESNTVDQWLRTLQALDQRRSQAFQSLNAADLDAVYLPGSPPWLSDRSLLTSYRDQQLRIEGLRMQIQTLEIERPGATTVVLRIVDRLAAGTAVDHSGHRTSLPPGTPTARRITLTATQNTWRIAAITKA